VKKRLTILILVLFGILISASWIGAIDWRLVSQWYGQTPQDENQDLNQDQLINSLDIILAHQPEKGGLKLDLFPPPQEIIRLGQSQQWPRQAGWTIVVVSNDRQDLVRRAAEYLGRYFQRQGISFQIKEQANPAQAQPRVVIGLSYQSDYLQQRLNQLQIKPVSESQGYVLITDQDGEVVIAAADGLGALYGVTSLIQLFQLRNDNLSLKEGVIRDWPDIKYRVWGELKDFNRWNLTEE